MNQRARMARNFATPQMLAHHSMHAAAYRTAVARMFISVGLADKIVDAIMDEQGHNTPHALQSLGQERH